MSLVKSLLNQHKAKLDEDQLKAAHEYLRRRAATELFAFPIDMTQTDAQTGFLLFEREFHGTPVRLFGQDVASLAHTRLRIFRAQRMDDGGYAPTHEIFSARISEKALTQAMFEANRSEGSALTVTRLGSYMTPPFDIKTRKAERVAQSLTAGRDSAFDEAVTDMLTLLAGEPMKSNAAIRDAAERIGYKVRDMTSTTYDLERHLEAMSMVRTEVLTEAAHAALHAQKILDAMSMASQALPAPDQPDWTAVSAEHPMVDNMLDPLPHDLREALRILIVSDIETLAAAHPRMLNWIKVSEEGPIVSFPPPRDRGVSYGTGTDRDAVKERVDGLSHLWNWAFNPHVEDSRQRHDVRQASLAISQRSGWLGNIHSTLPPTEGQYFSLRIASAWEETDYGLTAKIRSSSNPVIEIEMVAEDLMTALRGHPDGSPVSCSIRAMCGIWRHPAERPVHKITTDIASMSQQIASTPEVIELRDAVDALRAFTDSKRSGKVWRSDVESCVTRINTAYEAAKNRVSLDLGIARETVDTHVVKSAEGILNSISKSLPRSVISLLQISSKKE
ncbi:hypothetical protein ACOI1H_23860 [Loktanella sp. DJP18]|uniref:hypothetical protein n=1 Tax=Loktanella sp. DJP18 TaxID=3409788 RepID=UPI003BB51A58